MCESLATCVRVWLRVRVWTKTSHLGPGAYAINSAMPRMRSSARSHVMFTPPYIPVYYKQLCSSTRNRELLIMLSAILAACTTTVPSIDDDLQ